MNTLQASRTDRDHASRLFGGSGWRPADLDLLLALRTDANVLVTGPTEAARALARQVHDESGWRHGPFTVIDCRHTEGLERELAEAFYLAVPKDPRPRLRLMQAGTVLLQEVGEMPDELQALLADQLEELRRRGRSRPRVLASHSESLLPRIAEGTFDERLYYRLNVIHLVANRRGKVA